MPWTPPDPEAIGVSRRMFFNRATVTLTSAGLGAFFAAGFVAFLWPTASGGFGQDVTVGKLDDILDTIRTGDGFFYAPSARTWITEYPSDALPKARAVYDESILAGMEQGIVALYQKCPHLGCRVPSCATSQWFECPCHGSQYNRVGEKKAGPAPRGMDRFPVTIGANGDVVVSTGECDRHRPSHRHQHDRTGGGRAALHHRRWCALIVALATTTIAYILLAVVIGGWIVYAFLNGRSARSSVGSEIELAPNRKPYFDDETLEGRRLERVQLIGVLLLVVVVIGLPLYWIFEPSRMRGAAAAEEETFIERGAQLFAPTGDNLQALNCAGCHGGMNATGGEAPYTVASATTGEVRAVDWKAPALNTVFYRFSREEVRYIITYGRPGSPMSAWGLDGGGPLNSQQIDNLLDYLESIQIPREDCIPEEEGDPLCESGHLPAEIQADIEQAARQSVEDGTYDELRRGAVQPRSEQRRLQLRPLPHRVAGATAIRACRARVRSAGTSRAAARTPGSRSSRTCSSSSRRAPRTASGTPRRPRAAGACLASGSC